jgi:FKBP-type peptidyl-prolyl cis-trans isomerase
MNLYLPLWLLCISLVVSSTVSIFLECACTSCSTVVQYNEKGRVQDRVPSARKPTFFKTMHICSQETREPFTLPSYSKVDSWSLSLHNRIMSLEKKSPAFPTGKNNASSTYSSSSKRPKSVLDKIVAAIRALKDISPKGSSRSSIQKYCKDVFEYDNPVPLKKAFQQGVQKGVLVQTGQSFRVAADPIIEPETAKDGPVLVVEDLEVGIGDEIAEEGDIVTVSYRGTLENGHEFDKATKFSFVLGAGDVIKGWDQGIRGMKRGGKRKLVVPPKLGYGKRGCKPDIPGDATLYFEVILRGFEKS